MASKQDYYETLGLRRGASDDDVRKAYKRLVRKYHPDVNPGDKAADEKFKQLQEANEVLSDPKKRAIYDQYGFYSENIGGAGGARAGGGQPHMDFGGFDFTDMFGAPANEEVRGGSHISVKSKDRKSTRLNSSHT